MIGCGGVGFIVCRFNRVTTTAKPSAGDVWERSSSLTIRHIFGGLDVVLSAIFEG